MKIKKEQGSIIVFSLLILSVLVTVSLTLIQIFAPKIRVIFEATNSVSAIYSSDSAMEWCLYQYRGKGDVPPPIMFNGATYQIYEVETGAVSNCIPSEASFNYRTVGTFNGVSRSFQAETAAQTPTPSETPTP